MSSSKEPSQERRTKVSQEELDKYWQVIHDNPSDFSGWTYLLHYVEQENDMEAATDAFTKFFKRYPYCYGYWKKYADMAKSLISPEAAEKLFEEGVKAVPLSVDLWIHYVDFYKKAYKDKEGSYDKVKALFERALEAAGNDFRSDRLWDSYIKWEEENGNLKAVTAAYDKLFAIPTRLYSDHFDKFSKHVRKCQSPRDVLSTEEFLSLRKEVVVVMETETDDDDEDKANRDLLPPGVESNSGDATAELTKATHDMLTETQAQEMKQKIIEMRRVLHQKNQAEVGKRWAFEEGIKRPYFHVKALERTQLKNWNDYLDFEVANGTHQSSVVLFERCLIACALYEDMWLKYAKYLKEKDPESVSAIYEKACTIHLPKKPKIYFAWACFEELRGNPDKASEILSDASQAVPDLIAIMTRRINLERRRGNTTKVEELYLKYTSEAKNPAFASFFAVKFARFLAKVEGDNTRAKDVITEALKSDPLNSKLYLQYIDIGYQSIPVDIPTVCAGFDMALESQLTEEAKLVFSQRKLEFLEDFGLDSEAGQKAYEEHVERLKSIRECAKKRPIGDKGDPEKAKRAKVESNGNANPPAAPDSLEPSSGAPAAAPAVDATGYQYHQAPWGAYHGGNYDYSSWNYPSSYYPTH